MATRIPQYREPSCLFEMLLTARCVFPSGSTLSLVKKREKKQMKKHNALKNRFDRIDKK